jgi:hypothetical protein
MEIERELKGAIESYIGSDKFKEHIANQAEKMVNEAVSNCFRSYGDIGKNIEAAVKEALAFDVKELGLAGYGKFIGEIVTQSLKKAIIDEKVQEKIEARIREITRVAPKVITYDDLKKAVIKHIVKDNLSCGEDFDEEYHSINDLCTFTMERNGSFIRIYIDSKPDTNINNCNYYLSIYEGTGSISIKIMGEQLNAVDKITAWHFGFDDYLHGLFLSDTKADFKSFEEEL